jgi:leucyl/phenylalanyl-tRNA--protein transferase
MVALYLEMQKLGLVATVGTYRDGQLVGGLFGLEIGRVFSISSMFHRENNAGAMAISAIVGDIATQQGRWSLIECGLMNSTWLMYGAKEVSLSEFSHRVIQNLR